MCPMTPNIDDRHVFSRCRREKRREKEKSSVDNLPTALQQHASYQARGRGHGGVPVDIWCEFLVEVDKIDFL